MKKSPTITSQCVRWILPFLVTALSACNTQERSSESCGRCSSDDGGH